MSSHISDLLSLTCREEPASRYLYRGWSGLGTKVAECVWLYLPAVNTAATKSALHGQQLLEVTFQLITFEILSFPSIIDGRDIHQLVRDIQGRIQEGVGFRGCRHHLTTDTQDTPIYLDTQGRIYEPQETDS